MGGTRKKIGSEIEAKSQERAEYLIIPFESYDQDHFDLCDTLTHIANISNVVPYLHKEQRSHKN